MNAILKPLFLGITAYFLPVAIFFIMRNFIKSHLYTDVYLLYHILILATPLLFSGYIGAKFTNTSFRWLKILFGMSCGLIGFTVTLLVTKTDIDTMIMLLLVLAAAVVTYIGGFIGSKSKNAL